MSDAICYPDWIYTPNTRGELNAEDRRTREVFYQAGSYDIAPQLAQLSLELTGQLATLSKLATELSKRYRSFMRLKNEQSARIPGGGCEAELALYARPEIKSVDEAVWHLVDLLSIGTIGSTVLHEREVGE